MGFQGPRLVSSREAGCPAGGQACPLQEEELYSWFISTWLFGHCLVISVERLKAGGAGVTEDETVGWRHRLDGHEFEQAPGVGDGQGGCSPWGRRVRHD